MEYIATQLAVSAAGFISGVVVGATWVKSNYQDRKSP